MPDFLHAVLYTSALAPTTPISAVGAVVASSRRSNRDAAITGLLVFDGVGFSQYLEGPPEAVAACLDRIRADRRHADFRLAYAGPCGERRFSAFGLGYAVADGDPPSEAIALLTGDAALAYFLSLVPGLDLHT